MLDNAFIVDASGRHDASFLKSIRSVSVPTVNSPSIQSYDPALHVPTGPARLPGLAMSACAAVAAVTLSRRSRRGLSRRGRSSRRASVTEFGAAADPKAASFPFPHWLWQHAIARFEAQKLASGDIGRANISTAWDLHYNYGYLGHAKVEDENMFPVLFRFGGQDVVNRLSDLHTQLNAKATEISMSLEDRCSSTETILGLMEDWRSLLNNHMDLEETELMPLICEMPQGELSSLSEILKQVGEDAPGAKMILCLFRDLAGQGGVIKQVYESKFPMILRYGVIPVLANIDKQYAQHRQIFGELR